MATDDGDRRREPGPDDLVHQVSDWYSGVAIKMGRRQGATKEHF
jgi:hypothetical protein